MKRALLLLVPALLIATPATADDAPIDLASLRAEWPGQDWLILDRSLVFEMPSPDLLRVTRTRSIAILQESAREELALLTERHRPGCREVVEITVRTTTRDGDEHLLERDGMIEQPVGDHPTRPERGTIDLSGPVRGLAPGSRVDETLQVDYPAACYGGLLATVRALGHGDAPTLRETVEIRCAGDGCFFAVDQAGFDEAFVAAEQGVRLEREGVRPLYSEAAAPKRRLPRLAVSSSDDRLAAARVLAEGLAEHEGPARARVAGYVKDAKAAYPAVDDPVERLARFLGNDVPIIGRGKRFWTQGFDFGEAVKAADRPLLPLEWWAIAVAGLRPHGGVPVLLDARGHLEPPAVGNVTDYDQIGVLLPGRGVVTHLRWIPTHEGTARSLAGRWMLRLEEDEPALVAFPSSSAADRRVWTGTVSLDESGWVRSDLAGSFRGYRGHALRDSFETRLGWWKKASKKHRSSEEERDRKFVGDQIFKRQIAVGHVELPEQPTGIELKAIHTQDGLWNTGEGVAILTLPLPETPPLLKLAGVVDRQSDFALRPQERVVELEIPTPQGYSLVGVPDSIRVDEGPVQAELAWEQLPTGARLRLRVAIEDAIIPAELAPALVEAAWVVGRASDAALIYTKDE